MFLFNVLELKVIYQYIIKEKCILAWHHGLLFATSLSNSTFPTINYSTIFNNGKKQNETKMTYVDG